MDITESIPSEEYAEDAFGEAMRVFCRFFASKLGFGYPVSAVDFRAVLLAQDPELRLGAATFLLGMSRSVAVREYIARSLLPTLFDALTGLLTVESEAAAARRLLRAAHALSGRCAAEISKHADVLQAYCSRRPDVRSCAAEVLATLNHVPVSVITSPC